VRETPNARLCLERIFGFLVTSEAGGALMPEWQRVHAALGTIADYHRVVQGLASDAARLCDELPRVERNAIEHRIISVIQRLQEVAPEDLNATR